MTQIIFFHFIEFNTNNNVLLHFVLHTFRCRNSVGFVSLSGETRRQRNKSRQYKNSGVETDLSHCQVRQGDNAIKADRCKNRLISLSGETRQQRNKSRQYKNSGVKTDLSHCQVRQGDNLSRTNNSSMPN